MRSCWEALLARQPDVQHSRRVAAALRGLVKARLQSKEASAQLAVLGKRTIDRPHGGFVMCKVSAAPAAIRLICQHWH